MSASFLNRRAAIDNRLVSLVEPVLEESAVADSQLAALRQMEVAWNSASAKAQSLPVLQLLCSDSAAKRSLGEALANRLTTKVFRLNAAFLPTNLVELETLHRLWEREAILQEAALLLECDDASKEARRTLAIDRRIERAMPILEVSKPTTSERRAAWQQALGDRAQNWNGQLDRRLAQFNFSLGAIRATADSLGEKAETDLWRACRLRGRPRLQELAQHISVAPSARGCTRIGA